MVLPYFQSDMKTLSQLQTTWKTQLDPLLNNPITDGNILKNVSLASGTTVIPHLLGRNQQGWTIVDITGAATIYRSQALNDKTLTLTSNAAVTVSLLVF